MALDKLAICNEALRECPHEPIASFEEPGRAAPVCAERYPQALETLLAMHDWKAPVTRENLAVVTNDRPGEWAYCYALPTDNISELRVFPAAANPIVALAPGQIMGPTTAFPYLPSLGSYSYLIAGDRLYSNVENAVLEFVDAGVSEARFSPLFVRALVLECASRFVYPLLKDSKREGELIKKAEVARDRAIAEERNRDPSESTYGWFQNESELAREGAMATGWVDGYGWPWVVR